MDLFSEFYKFVFCSVQSPEIWLYSIRPCLTNKIRLFDARSFKKLSNRGSCSVRSRPITTKREEEEEQQQHMCTPKGEETCQYASNGTRHSKVSQLAARIRRHGLLHTYTCRKTILFALKKRYARVGF